METLEKCGLFLKSWKDMSWQKSYPKHVNISQNMTCHLFFHTDFNFSFSISAQFKKYRKLLLMSQVYCQRHQKRGPGANSNFLISILTSATFTINTCESSNFDTTQSLTLLCAFTKKVFYFANIKAIHNFLTIPSILFTFFFLRWVGQPRKGIIWFHCHRVEDFIRKHLSNIPHWFFNHILPFFLLLYVGTWVTCMLNNGDYGSWEKIIAFWPYFFSSPFGDDDEIKKSVGVLLMGSIITRVTFFLLHSLSLSFLSCLDLLRSNLDDPWQMFRKRHDKRSIFIEIDIQ